MSGKAKRKNLRPFYDRRKKNWRVEFEDRDAEEGGLIYVVSEFARTGLYFPFHDSASRGREYPDHAHSFEGVLRALLDDPAGFSIEGFEEYYSAQEREMLHAVREKLLELDR